MKERRKERGEHTDTDTDTDTGTHTHTHIHTHTHTHCRQKAGGQTNRHTQRFRQR